MDEPTYYALTGDIVGSRDLADRAGVQRALQSTVVSLNDRLDSALASPLKLVAGDEVQGLLRSAEAAVDVVVEIADELHPTEMAWGLGRGGLTTDLADDVSLLDGPCLHRARDAVERAAAEDVWLVAAGIRPPHDEVLTRLFHLMGVLRGAWTETQLRYVREARHRLQTEVAEIYGVTKQAVSKSLDAAHFSVVSDAERTGRRLLRWIDRDG